MSKNIKLAIINPNYTTWLCTAAAHSEGTAEKKKRKKNY